MDSDSKFWAALTAVVVLGLLAMLLIGSLGCKATTAAPLCLTAIG